MKDIVICTVLVALLAISSLTLSAEDCEMYPEQRIDCFPESTPLTEEQCKARGCCYHVYSSGANLDNVPWCFFPTNYAYSYVLTSFNEVSYGYKGVLKLANRSSYPLKALPVLNISIIFETPERLHFKITDYYSPRYEVPIDVPKVTEKTSSSVKYKVETSDLNQPFYIRISRVETGVVLFDTSVAPLLYGDQYLHISTKLPSNNIYGLGERHARLRPDTYWNRIPFWAADHAPGSPAGGNLYGDHPFYVGIESGGLAHGVFFLNSNAKEAELSPEPALTWRTIGGILDFYVFLGPSSDRVIEQYTDVIGRPFMPPMWSLGFHLCRWGYKTSNTTWEYVQKMRNAQIPQDVQWNDIDYMEKKLDFTYNQNDFDTLPNMVDDLHAHNQHYVMIIDPGISYEQSQNTYPPYDDALSLDILVKDANTKKPVHGKVWPGGVVFPDFTHPNVQDYWTKQLLSYHQMVPFDGVWIDMNELSNFMDGSPELCYTNNTYDYPPYVPKVTGGKLFSKTVCPSSMQYMGVNYNVHSLTGLFEMKATSNALKTIREKRPFVISRSTFPSAGKYGGHWTGDIRSTWEHLQLSVPGILTFNLFGIPMVGADICGFGGITNNELCIRWSQLGAFYPFSRNHNDIAGTPQAPVDFSGKTQEIIKNAFNIRYSLLPYLYTLFHHANRNGTTVARPLFFEFPTDPNTYALDEQFLWGPALMISPVLYEALLSVLAYFPKGVWYDISMEFGKQITSTGKTFEISAPLESIPVHVRGGYIIPGCLASTVTSVKNKLQIIAAADEYGLANGTLFLDDGESLDTYEKGEYAYIHFKMQREVLSSQLISGSKTFTAEAVVHSIHIMGLNCNPVDVKVNGASATYNINAYGSLHIEANDASVSDLVATWSCK